MRPKVAYRRIESFRKRFGEAHLYLAYHAAFPLALTPDLLYRLWANFQRDIHSEVVNIPWIAVADLLLSSLCNEVGHEIYEMEKEVRNALLSELEASPSFGTQRINELSSFLLAYVRQQLNSRDLDTRDFAQAQKWTALAYTQPSEVVSEIASALSKMELEDKTEWLRMMSLLETLAEPLAEFEPLLIYVRGMAHFAYGDWESAATQFSRLPEQGNQVQLAGVSLNIPSEVSSSTDDKDEFSYPVFEDETLLLADEFENQISLDEGTGDGEPSAPNIGTLLNKRYRLVEMLAQSNMGQVYRAEDVLLGGVNVAVKFLSKTLLNYKMRTHFAQEVAICARLGEKSHHIVRVKDYGVESNKIPYYVMEYLEGEILSRLIRAKPFSLRRFLNISHQICLGLQCAHNGIFIEGKICPIIHLDLKPKNIFIIQNNAFGELVKILDFGMAKLFQEESVQSDSFIFFGTLAYCSPEQIEKKKIDKRSDIYSLGIMMFEMLTGELPLLAETHSFSGWYKAHRFFPPRSFKSANPNLKLPKALENLVMSCMAKEPSARPQSVEEVLQALERLE